MSSSQVTLRGNQFYELLCRMFYKHFGTRDIKEVLKNKGMSQTFGYGNYDMDSFFLFKKTYKNSKLEEDRKKTLKAGVVQNKEVIKLLKKQKLSIKELDFKRLYEKHHKFEKTKKSEQDNFGINRKLAAVCFAYIGIQTKEELNETEGVLKTSTNNQEVNQVIKLKYKGFYYSYRKHTVQSFHIAISYAAASDSCEVEEEGFHDNIKTKFFGKAKIRLGRLCVLLTSDDFDGDIFLVLSIPNNINEMSALVGTLSTISSHDGFAPICTEIMLVRKDDEFHKIYQKAIERYFYLHRYNFKTNTREIQLDGLRAKGRSVNFLETRLKGTYRVWRFDEQFNIVKSKLEVNPNYKISCITEQYNSSQYNEQVCLLHPNKDNVFGGNTLCISTHPKIHTGIISYLMLDISKSKPKSKFLHGVLIYFGENASLTKKTVLLEPTKEKIEPGVIERNELNSFLKKKKNRAVFDELVKKETLDYLPQEIGSLVL